MTMTSIKLENAEVVIIPAEMGWTVCTARAGDTKLDTDPVIAWSIEWDTACDAFQVRPITYNTGRNSLCNLIPGYVLGDPFGNFAAMWDLSDGYPKTMQTEAEAVQHCIDEKAEKEGTAGVIEDGHEREAPWAKVFESGLPVIHLKQGGHSNE
jgi:hypothetical protein